MKNVAVVVAGDSGTRMGQDIPKQFINVFDKPVLIYTLESFQRHPDVDGIRPLIDADVLTDVIQVCERYGNAVTSLPYNEQIFVINQDDPSTTVQYVPREQLRRVSTPQAYRYGKLLAAYRKAFKENIGIHGSSYTNTMMVDLGETLHFAKGSDKNIKLTTKGDLELFKAYITADEDTWLK